MISFKLLIDEIIIILVNSAIIPKFKIIFNFVAIFVKVFIGKYSIY